MKMMPSIDLKSWLFHSPSYTNKFHHFWNNNTNFHHLRQIANEYSNEMNPWIVHLLPSPKDLSHHLSFPKNRLYVIKSLLFLSAGTLSFYTDRIFQCSLETLGLANLSLKEGERYHIHIGYMILTFYCRLRKQLYSHRGKCLFIVFASTLAFNTKK